MLDRASIDGSAFAFARRAFLFLLGASYLSAFISFGVQARGLIGLSGIWPFQMTLDWAKESTRVPALSVPSLLWLWPSDAGLIAACVLGAVSGVAAAAQVWPKVSLAAAWALYLSLVSVGGIFFGYQWDSLLLETGFLAIFLAPWRRERKSPGLIPPSPALSGDPDVAHRSLATGQAPSSLLGLARNASAIIGSIRVISTLENPPPSGVGLLLARVLLFRLMFMSGVVKLLSGDPTWRSLSGLQFHYWSQPLPTWSSYFVDLLPAWIDRICEATMFGVELVAPFLLFGPARVRRAAASAMVLLQVAIAATGNYGFFNLLTVALCALQLDDALWMKLPGVGRLVGKSPGSIPRSRAARYGWIALAGLLLLFGAIDVSSRVWRRASWPGFVERLADALEPFRLVGRYGLFAVMTTQRDEIELAGSDDGQTWKPYGFHYKPGPLNERPRFAPLHMPRLDWQMWFASLGACGQNEWLLLLQKRLLEGGSLAQGLFAHDPFPTAPPTFIRTRIAPYRFASFADWWKTGAYWTRGAERDYCPPLMLDHGQLRKAAIESVGP